MLVGKWNEMFRPSQLAQLAILNHCLFGFLLPSLKTSVGIVKKGGLLHTCFIPSSSLGEDMELNPPLVTTCPRYS